MVFFKMVQLSVVPSLKDFVSAINVPCTVTYMKQAIPDVCPVLVASIGKYICLLKFLREKEMSSEKIEQTISGMFPGFEYLESKKVQQLLDLSKFDISQENKDLKLLVQGTEFQEAVWKQLLLIPHKSLCYYSDIAEGIGRPSAVRAVASAVGNNRIPYIIPCHRVVGKGGNVLKFSCGSDIKKLLMEKEGISVEKAAVSVTALPRKLHL